MSFEPPKPQAGPLPAADVQAPADQEKIEYEPFPVRKAAEDLEDFKVQVRASTLRRVRGKLEHIRDPEFQWHELALGIATLSYGGFLGAIPAKLVAGEALAIFFYSVLPVVGTGALVAYLFLRHPVHQSPARISSDALNELPDPDKAR